MKPEIEELLKNTNSRKVRVRFGNGEIADCFPFVELSLGPYKIVSSVGQTKNIE